MICDEGEPPRKYDRDSICTVVKFQLFFFYKQYLFSFTSGGNDLWIFLTMSFRFSPNRAAFEYGCSSEKLPPAELLLPASQGAHFRTLQQAGDDVKILHEDLINGNHLQHGNNNSNNSNSNNHNHHHQITTSALNGIENNGNHDQNQVRPIDHVRVTSTSRCSPQPIPKRLLHISVASLLQ